MKPTTVSWLSVWASSSQLLVNPPLRGGHGLESAKYQHHSPDALWRHGRRRSAPRFLVFHAPSPETECLRVLISGAHGQEQTALKSLSGLGFAFALG